MKLRWPTARDLETSVLRRRFEERFRRYSIHLVDRFIKVLMKPMSRFWLKQLYDLKNLMNLTSVINEANRNVSEKLWRKNISSP